jgi:hypothetical protein
MRTKIVYHKHSIRNVYLFIYFTCFHLFIFYISLNQINVVYFFRRISLFFISHRHFISSSHLVVISSRCHLASLSQDELIKFRVRQCIRQKDNRLKNFSQDDTSQNSIRQNNISQKSLSQKSLSQKRQKNINQKSEQSNHHRNQKDR